MLEIRKLTKKYTAGPQALKGVDLSIKEGEIVALIGPSGAGKSTLIRCINRLVEPTSGEILFHGVDVCKLGARALRETRKKIGMIFQEYALVDRLSVMENVLSGRLGSVGFWASARRKFPQEDVEEALFLLERVGLADYVDTRADQLSGGQRQRVGICRALLQRPDLLLIDEPTASLDPKRVGRLCLITELVRSATWLPLSTSTKWGLRNVHPAGCGTQGWTDCLRPASREAGCGQPYPDLWRGRLDQLDQRRGC